MLFSNTEEKVSMGHLKEIKSGLTNRICPPPSPSPVWLTNPAYGHFSFSNKTLMIVYDLSKKIGKYLPGAEQLKQSICLMKIHDFIKNMKEVTIYPPQAFFEK